MQPLNRIKHNVHIELGANVPEEYRESYRQFRHENNLVRSMIVAFSTIVTQALTIGYHLLASDVRTELDYWFLITCVVYALMMAGAGIYLSGKLRTEAAQVSRAAPYIFWALFLGCELAMNCWEIVLRGSEFRAYAIILMIALVPLFTRKTLFLYMGIFFACIALMVAFFGNTASYSYTHFYYWALYASATIFFSLINLSSFVNGFVSNKKLTQANEQMSSAYDNLQNLNEELDRMSTTDQLTHVANRRAFDEYFERSWAQCKHLGEPIAMLAIDVDHFKGYNNRFGHQQGDLCLQRIAAALQARLDHATSMLARYGGEEFAVLLPFAGAEDALLSAAEDLRTAVEALQLPNPDSTNSPYITISIGLAVRVPDALGGPEALVRLSMVALGDAKRQGRNRVVADIDSARGAFVAPRGAAVQAPGSGEDLLKLHTILTNTTMATFSLDLATGGLDFSPEILRYVDAPTHFDQIQDLYAYIYEGDLEKLVQGLTDLSGGYDDGTATAFRMRIRDGNYRWVNAVTSLLLDETGRPVEAVGSLTDISDQMREQEITRLMADGAANYLFSFDFSTQELWCNDLLCRDFGLDPSYLGRSLMRALLPDDRRRMLGALRGIRLGKTDMLELEIRACKPGGPVAHLSCRGLSNRDALGKAALLAGTVVDTTEQVKSRLINRLIVDGSSDCVYVFDIRENTLEFSPKMMSIAKLSSLTFESGMEGFLECVVQEDRDRFSDALAAIYSAKTDEYALEIRLIGPDGAPVWTAWRGKASFDDNQEPTLMAGSIFNIEAMGQYNTYLEEQSLTDRVTQLPNRISFYRDQGRRLREEPNEGHIVMIDLDDFKSINNMYGHAVGDEVLKRFGSGLLMDLPKGSMLYHMGGDLFVADLSALSGDATLEWMASLRDKWRKTIDIGGKEIYITFSMGAVEYREGQGVDELLTDAEITMHRVKYQGKDGFATFDPSDREDYLQKIELENRLRHAVEHKFDGFELYYQPLISAMDGACLGAEALIRWRDPDGRLVPPAEILPCLEAAGLMPAVEGWILHAAVKQCRAWIDKGAGENFIMNINLTPPQITRHTLTEEVLALVHHYRLKPGNITLEITEGSCVMEMQGDVHALGQLMGEGVGIAIDDFGTGYSSLSYLRELPITETKIDRSFVRDIETDPEGRQFLSSIIRLAHSIGHLVCVEGVETVGQCSVIMSLDADLMQGYLFSQPLASGEFEKKIFSMGDHIVASV